MILIISDAKDVSTHDVVDWLCHYGETYFVLNKEDAIQDIQFELTSEGIKLFLTIDGHVIDLSTVSTFWYRRGFIRFDLPDMVQHCLYGKKIANHLTSEWRALSEFIYTLLESKKSIGAFSKERYNNKLANLVKAFQCGLAVPETLVFSNKEIFSSGLSKNKLITKSLNDDIYYNEDNKVEFANFGPMLIDQQHLENMEDHFWPSLFQGYVDKQYELRIFVLHEKIYASVVFSQLNASSMIDSRLDDFDNRVRMVPYQLPEDIEQKLLQYMKLTEQNTASVDMIVNKKNEYVFLESNPVGQFGYLSYNCNYHLEQEVANYLISA